MPSGKRIPDSATGRAHRARPAQPRSPARVRAADHRPAGLVAEIRRPGASGWIGLPRSRRCVLRQPERVPARARAAAADGGDRSRVARRGARRHRGSAADARARSADERVTAACSSAARTRRAAGRSASCSSPAWPSGCFRSSRTKIRCCSIARCACRSARVWRCRRIARRPSGCCCGSRSARPTERLWLSYPRLEMAESRPRVP